MRKHAMIGVVVSAILGCQGVETFDVGPDDSYDGGVVAATCRNNTKDQDEADIDCGGACTAKCMEGASCAVNADCASGTCDTTMHCVVSMTCDDNVKNGQETDVDCGRFCPFPKQCADGKQCQKDADCVSLNCANGICEPNTRVYRVVCDSIARSGCQVWVHTSTTPSTGTTAGQVTVPQADLCRGTVFEDGAYDEALHCNTTDPNGADMCRIYKPDNSPVMNPTDSSPVLPRARAPYGQNATASHNMLGCPTPND